LLIARAGFTSVPSQVNFDGMRSPFLNAGLVIVIAAMAVPSEYCAPAPAINAKIRSKDIDFLSCPRIMYPLVLPIIMIAHAGFR